jgi:hypothetical protein
LPALEKMDAADYGALLRGLLRQRTVRAAWLACGVCAVVLAAVTGALSGAPTRALELGVLPRDRD